MKPVGNYGEIEVFREVESCGTDDHDSLAFPDFPNYESWCAAIKRLIANNSNATTRIVNPRQEYLMATNLFIRSLATIAIAAILLPTSITSAAVIIPAGLNPGDNYHLVFVTEGIRDAMSINIQDYNDFVQSEAARNSAITGTDIGVQYRAIASTATVDARDNALIRAPVYRIDGTMVATGFADMWDAQILVEINQNQWSNAYSGHVWTGSYANGFGVNTHPIYKFGGPWVLGFYGGVPTQRLAQLGATNQGETDPWIFREFFTASIASKYPLYALSDLLVVPAPVPEPSSFVSLASVSICMAGWSWRRSRKG